MTSPDHAQNLESALEAVLRDLLDAENELARATFRVHHAREAAGSLQALVGNDRARRIAEEVGVPFPLRRVQSGPSSEAVAARRLAMERRRAAEEADIRRTEGRPEGRNRLLTAQDGPAQQRPREDPAPRISDSASSPEPQPRPSGDEPSSTDRVIELLREYEGKAIPRGMILEQFEKRGWIHPSWGHPGQAIRMAIKRAEARHAVKQVSEGRYTYNDPGLLGEATGGDD
jgi:hypothetical protein